MVDQYLMTSAAQRHPKPLTREQHEAALNAATAKLKAGDVGGYWDEIATVSKAYGALAGSVARDELHGKGARERLQDANEVAHGRRLTERELDKIETDIANADLKVRADNLDKHGEANVTLADTVEYHTRVFEDAGLPPETYTLKAVSDAMGEKANEIKDTDPYSTELFISHNITEALPEAISTAGEYISDTAETAGRALTGSEETDESNNEERPDPKTPPAPADQPSDAPAPARNDVAPQSKTMQREGQADPYPDDANAVRNALMLVDTESDDDFDTMLLKSPDILTEDEATQLGHHAFALKSNDPRKKAAEDLRRDFYDLAYSTEAVEYDATGRMITPTPKTEIPADPQPAKTSSGEVLKTALGRVAASVADAAAKNSKAPAVMALQTGLSLLGERLKIDGDPGPKTRGALTRTVAKQGASKAQDAFALGQMQQFAKAERNGGSASGLKDTVEKYVQPLFGSTAPKVAAATLQESLNDLQNKRLANRVDPGAAVTPPLKIDGDIGPKTTDAFRLALAHDGPERLTKTYGQNLGFGLDSDLS